jgi:hypothetical protein
VETNGGRFGPGRTLPTGSFERPERPRLTRWLWITRAYGYEWPFASAIAGDRPETPRTKD